MKKLLGLALALAMIPGLAFAAEPVLLYVNGIDGRNYEQQPILRDDRLFLPVRSVTEAMGYKVDWKGESKTVTVGDIEMVVGEKDYVAKGEKMTMDVAPFIEKDRTYVPLRFLADGMKLPVTWDGKNRVAVVGEYKSAPKFTRSKTVTYGNVTFSLPKDWEKQLVITYDHNQVTFYDKMNYEAQDGLGRIGEIINTANPDSPVPAILLAKGNCFYTLCTFASDVQVVDTGNQKLCDSYTKSNQLVREILKTVEIDDVYKEADRVKIGPVSMVLPEAYKDVIGVEEAGGNVLLFEKTNEKAKKGSGLIGTFRVVNQKELEKIEEDYRLFRYNKDGSLIFVRADKPSLKDPVLKKAYEEGVGKAGDILQTVK
ncbi:copper amine oxidase N-terminal domain-containing protein [Aedoeadaptatus pacaensis]|uniref:copper amine oxidase N-terminal domain-containing protein n=1 Tax=Aedoeadaptatus pacaensis TaxID=1776390 RepID=UPI00083991D4|nr:copper amine oxidase N-terminal domain-containing protein [Peptoniphilus pacaensis]